MCFLIELFFLVDLFFSCWLLHEAAPSPDIHEIDLYFFGKRLEIHFFVGMKNQFMRKV